MNQDSSASQLPKSIQKSGVEPEGRGSTGSADDRLREAMAPIMERSVLEVLERGSKGLIDSLYPLIGRAVRRSVRESLSALAQSVDRTMRDTLTLKQFRWRMEARRKGIPLAQLVMQKSLLFRVEEAFLIHQKTGLLVAHVGARADDNRDLISGMFTAIQDFVADSFGPSDRKALDELEQERLGRFQVGDQDVWLFHGPSAYMAIVITGNAAESYRDHFHAVLEEIHERYGAELSLFEGDGESLKPAGLLLEDCLIEQQREEVSTRSPRLFIVAVAILSLLLIGWLWKSWQTKQLHEGVRAHLDEHPGVVITEESRSWRASRFEVLADPEVLDVDASVEAAFPDQPVHLEVAPFRSMDPEAKAARLDRVLMQLTPKPATPVAWESSAMGFSLSGEVDHAWKVRAETTLPSLGVGVVDTSGLVDLQQEACVQKGRELAALEMLFLPNQAKVLPSEAPKWHRLAKEMRALSEAAEAVALPCRFAVYGKVSEGAGAWELYQERAQVAREALQAQGVPASMLGSGGWLLSELEGVEVAPDAIIVLSSFLLSPSRESQYD